MSSEPTWVDLKGNTHYYGIPGAGDPGDGSKGIFPGGVVVVRYKIDLVADVPNAGTASPSDYNVTFWAGGGDCEDWAVLNCFLTATDTAWGSGSMYMNLGDAGTAPTDDLIDNVVVNNSTSAKTRPHTPNYTSPTEFGSARHDALGGDHPAWPVSLGGGGNFSIFSSLSISLVCSGVTGPITDGYVQAAVVLLPLLDT